MNYPISEHKIISTAELREMEDEIERLKMTVLEVENARDWYKDEYEGYQHEYKLLKERKRYLEVRIAALEKNSLDYVSVLETKVEELTAENAELLDVVADLTAELERRPVGVLGY